MTSSDYPDLEAAMYSKLMGGTAITALIGGTADPRLYNRLAPLGATKPFLIFYPASELSSNSSPRDDFNTVYRVECVGSNGDEADSLYQAVYATLHGGDLTVTGWAVYWLAHERKTALVDGAEGVQRWRYIGDYRIRLDKS